MAKLQVLFSVWKLFSPLSGSSRRGGLQRKGPVAMFRIVKTASEWSLRASSSDARKRQASYGRVPCKLITFIFDDSLYRGFFNPGRPRNSFKTEPIIRINYRNVGRVENCSVPNRRFLRALHFPFFQLSAEKVC